MDSRRIEELLQRYWACETTLEEETQLREYFQNDNIPEQHREAAALFQYFNHSRKESILDKGFDQQVFARDSAKKDGKMVQLIRSSMRIAAGIAVLMIAIWFVRAEIRKDDPPVDTYDNPQLAFEETKKALMMISKGFAKAEQEAKKINLFNEAQENIQKEDSPKN